MADTPTRLPLPGSQSSASTPPKDLGYCWDKTTGKCCKFLHVHHDASGREECVCFFDPPIAGYKNAMVQPFDGVALMAHWCSHYIADTNDVGVVPIVIPPAAD